MRWIWFAGAWNWGRSRASRAALLFKWIADGYVVLEKAVPDEILDGALADANKAYEDGFPALKFNVNGVGKNLSWVPEVQTNATKALDLHWISEPIREAIFCDKVLEFLI